MSVVLSVEEVGPCRRQLRIEVPMPAVEAETARVLGDYGKRARIPGFRKGKVPANLVRRHFGKEIDQEVLERLVPRYWRQAAAEKGIDALLPPRVGDVDLAAGKPLTFTAIVEVRPEIELRNTADFDLPSPPVEATAEEIRSALDDLRRGHAQWIVAERSAATGDRAKIGIRELVDDGEAAPQELEVEVGSQQIWEELSLAVTGLALGQTARFARREGEGEAARERHFEVRLIELKAPQLPELDAEFAGHFGKFASVAELEADIARRLSGAKRDEARRQREVALLDQLTERHTFPLPDGVVHQEVEDLLRDYAESLARRGVDLEKAELDWQKLGEQARPQAERRVRARLLLDAIAGRDRIEVGEEEFEQALAIMARVQGVPTLALRQKLDENGQLAGLRAQMRREKVVRRLLGEAEPEGAASGA